MKGVTYLCELKRVANGVFFGLAWINIGVRKLIVLKRCGIKQLKNNKKNLIRDALAMFSMLAVLRHFFRDRQNYGERWKGGR